MVALPVFPTPSVATHVCCPASYDHSLSRLTVCEDPLTKQLLPQVELHWYLTEPLVPTASHRSDTEVAAR